MANMFSGKSNKQIPTTLSECTYPDATASNLHSWSEKLERWGQTLFIILVLVGIVSTIAKTVEMADINENMAFMTCITSLFTWALYAFIEYCAYHVLALLISALASITQNTIIAANVALYKESTASNTPEKLPQNQAVVTTITQTTPTEIVTNDKYWNCPTCGRTNAKDNKNCWNCNTQRK